MYNQKDMIKRNNNTQLILDCLEYWKNASRIY